MTSSNSNHKNPSLSAPVTKVPLVGSVYAKKLAKLDIDTIKDLLYHFPSRYIDSSEVKQIKDLNAIDRITIKAHILDIKNIRTKYGKLITTGVLEDESGTVEVIWFNQPYLTKTLKTGELYLFSGKLNPKSRKPILYSPEYEAISGTKETTHLARITPVYPTTEGISSKWLRARLKWVTDRLVNEDDLNEKEDRVDRLDRLDRLLRPKETLPAQVLESEGLVALPTALTQIHFPDSQEELKKAKERLAFDEMFAIQLKMVKLRAKRFKLKAPTTKAPKADITKFIESLDYELTTAQKRCVKEILADIAKPYPMSRLLQGDVGSGKTVVAAIAALTTVKAGYQVAIMAPTSILAEQHYQTFTNLFRTRQKTQSPPVGDTSTCRLRLGDKRNSSKHSHHLKDFNINIELVTSATSKKESKAADILIGTHALLFRKEDVFKNLGLIIIDEQHRFGVRQRKQLAASSKTGLIPHHLTLSATPIPRSIALALFGDTDVSIIDEMPPGRRATRTHLVPPEKREDAYQWIKEKLTGKDEPPTSVFWICPIIEESEALQTKAVTTELKKIRQIFSTGTKLNVEMLHGRMKEEEKNRIIKKLQDKKNDILVSTSVVEVGIDIPHANIMVIEGAERFGLAQLHQLRGRVGRRDQKSYCFLFTSPNPNTPVGAQNFEPLLRDETMSRAQQRLRKFCELNDGMKLAKYDLKLRGPGEVYGTQQAGIPKLKIANILDLKLIRRTRRAAERWIGKR